MDLWTFFTAPILTGLALIGLGVGLMTIDRVNRGIEDFGIISHSLVLAGLGIVIVFAGMEIV